MMNTSIDYSRSFGTKALYDVCEADGKFHIDIKLTYFNGISILY